MNRNSDGSEIHHNVFYGPTAIGTQYVEGAPQVAASPRQSVPTQAWRIVMLAWAMCPTAAWATHAVPEGFVRLTDIVHASTPFVWLAGAVALCLDAAGCLLYRRWAVVQRAVTDPVTWKLRLFAVALGGIALGGVVFMAGHTPR